MFRGLMPLRVMVLVAAMVAATPCLASDWPQYRGPNRNGVAEESGLARSWLATGPPVVWKRPLGEGFSGISVVGDRLYTAAAEGEQEMALCLDAKSGKEIWRFVVGPKFIEEFGNGPRATPTVDGDLVLIAGSTGKVFALRAADGSKVWELDLVASLKAQLPGRGFSGSVLVDGDVLVLDAGAAEGKALVGLDRATGSVRWATGEGTASHASPMMLTVDGVRQYVFLRRVEPELMGVSTAGKILWTQRFPATAIASPLLVPPDRFYVSTTHDETGTMFRVRKEGEGFVAEPVWSHNRFKNHWNPPVVLGGTMYGFDNATLRAIDAATGEVRWAARGYGKGSLIAADGLLIVLADQGGIGLVEATPEAYHELGRAQALEGRTWTAPALADGRLYLRDHDEIACFDLRPSGAPPAAPATATESGR